MQAQAYAQGRETRSGCNQNCCVYLYIVCKVTGQIDAACGNVATGGIACMSFSVCVHFSVILS